MNKKERHTFLLGKAVEQESKVDTVVSNYAKAMQGTRLSDHEALEIAIALNDEVIALYEAATEKLSSL